MALDPDDPACQFSSAFSPDDVDDLMKTLDPRVLLGTGCRVLKHPKCCFLCAMNEDCSRIPLHVNCRCKPEPYVSLGDEELAAV